jgi:ribulose kinase
VDAATGKEIACGVYEYQFGEEGIGWTAMSQPWFDNTRGLCQRFGSKCHGCSKKSAVTADFSIDAVVGIGIDATGTTMLPVLADGTPLACLPSSRQSNAYIWLGKTIQQHEKQKNYRESTGDRPAYMHMVGGSYSAESYWAKVCIVFV